jgi:hypothetical protein
VFYRFKTTVEIFGGFGIRGAGLSLDPTQEGPAILCGSAGCRINRRRDTSATETRGMKNGLAS